LAPRRLAHLEKYTLFSVPHNYKRGSVRHPSYKYERNVSVSINYGHILRVVYDLCMISVMVKKADLDRIGVPEDYKVLDATALGRRLGFKRETVLVYLSRRNFRRIPRPNRQLAMGPIWYEKSVRE
jgi:hypothetical protein